MSFVSQFKTAATRVAADTRQRQFIRTALRGYEVNRDKRKGAFQSWESARQAAAETKWEAINHLDEHLVALTAKLEARGTKVHWASNAAQAREIILKIVADKQARSIIKSKAMTSEEIHLNHALEKAGFKVIESDLGEFICQLRHEAPYHIVFPSMHLTRDEIRDLFQKELGDAPSNTPEDLTMVARRVMRQKYLQADIGFTGANFAVAETGMISITENEGNARLTAALPKTMITLLGIEKVLPRFADLALFLPMLATAGAGQPMTGYNTVCRAAPARRSRRAGGMARGAAGQPPHRIAGRCGAARRVALHSLRRVPECLPDFPQCGRAHLRHHLQRAGRLRHHAASARVTGLETSFQRQLAVRRLHRGVSGEN
jgi:L-lactate dehydrogenase complex protein LldF